MSAASLDAEIIRTEFDSAIERVVERLTALESTVSQLSRRGTRDDERTSVPSSEVVTQNEFRLFKWLATFALAAVLAGFGFLHQQIADLRVDFERQFADLRVDIERYHRDLLKEMNAQFAEVHREIGLLRERVRGVETRLDGVETRLGRVETRLDGVETRLDDVDTRLGRVESRFAAPT